MKNVTLLFFLSFFFICQNGFSQINPEILTKYKNKYYYQNRYYTFSELGPVLESNPKVYEIYKEYLEDKTIHRITLVLSAGTFYAWNRWRTGENGINCSGDCTRELGKILFSIPIVVVPTVAILYTISTISGKSKEVVRLFNADLNAIPKTGLNQIQLDFGSTNNGIGLVLNF